MTKVLSDEVSQEQKVIEAIKVIKKYCHRRKCKDCEYNNSDGCMFENYAPEDWIIEE